MARLLPAFLLVAAAGVAADGAAKPGELRFLSSAGQTLAAIRGAQAGDAFGVAHDAQAVQGTRGGGILVGAPGAAGGGRAYLFDLGDLSVFQVLEAAGLGGPLERFGESLIQIGHINGANGVHWVVGAPGNATDPQAPGAVVILHQVGLQYAERLRISAPGGSLFGWTLASVDHDFTDSIIDHFAVGAPREARGSKEAAGSVSMYDAVTGEVIWKTLGGKKHGYFGYALWPVPDVDGDGIADLLVGAPGRPNRRPAGRAFLLSGTTGRPIRQIKAPREAVLFGFDVARWPLSGDMLVGAPATPIGSADGAGAAYLIAGDGSGTRRIDGSRAGDWFGQRVGFSDFDGDGAVDAMVADALRDARARKDYRGRVSFYDLNTGDLLASFRGKQGGDHFGLGGFEPSADRDGDSVPDYLASNPRAPLAFVPQ